MATVFYDHLISWDRTEQYLVSLGLSREEQLELLELIEEIMHTEIWMLLLSHLPQERHDEFLEQFHRAPFDAAHLANLQTYVPEIHVHIQHHSQTVIEKIMAPSKESFLSKLKQWITSS